MAQVTSDRIESFLDRYGWTYKSAGENLWQTGWQGETASYPLELRLTNTCVSFEVKPFLNLPVEWKQWPELSRDLLTLNDRMQIAKISICENGLLVLSCQVLVAGFDYKMMSRILGILGYYADTVSKEIFCKLEAYGYLPAVSFLS